MPVSEIQEDDGSALLGGCLHFIVRVSCTSISCGPSSSTDTCTNSACSCSHNTLYRCSRAIHGQANPAHVTQSAHIALAIALALALALAQTSVVALAIALTPALAVFAAVATTHCIDAAEQCTVKQILAEICRPMCINAHRQHRQHTWASHATQSAPIAIAIALALALAL